LTINESLEMGKDHFIKLYTGKTTGKTESNMTFYGDTGIGDMTYVHMVELKINNLIFYTPVYNGAPTTGCCSTLTGQIEV